MALGHEWISRDVVHRHGLDVLAPAVKFYSVVRDKFPVPQLIFEPQNNLITLHYFEPQFMNPHLSTKNMPET